MLRVWRGTRHRGKQVTKQQEFPRRLPGAPAPWFCSLALPSFAWRFPTSLREHFSKLRHQSALRWLLGAFISVPIARRANPYFSIFYQLSASGCVLGWLHVHFPPMIFSKAGTISSYHGYYLQDLESYSRKSKISVWLWIFIVVSLSWKHPEKSVYLLLRTKLFSVSHKGVQCRNCLVSQASVFWILLCLGS